MKMPNQARSFIYLIQNDKQKYTFSEFLQFALNQEEMRQKWLASVQECQRLHCVLEKAHYESADLERKLSHARRLLDEEKRRRRNAEEQRNSLVRIYHPIN